MVTDTSWFVMVHCRVRGCRFASSHTTSGHVCGSCGECGHGQIECGRPDRIAALAAYRHERLPVAERCDRENCLTPSWSHSRHAHCCASCRAHGDECRCNTHSRQCPTCKTIGDVRTDLKKYTGGDCIVCYESKPMVEFTACGHVNVCAECVVRL